jgi:hypothetical protein
LAQKISTVFLFDLHLRSTNRDVVMHCTRNFFEMARTHLGAPRGPSLRVGTFDFLQVNKDHYEGIPDERNAASYAESMALCPRILNIYRSAITFGIVFDEPGSYETWMAFNHRPPTSRQLGELARAKGLRVPFLDFPYKSPLVPDDRLEAKLAASLVTTAQPQVYHSRHEIRGMPKAVKPVNNSVAATKIAALANHFKRV